MALTEKTDALRTIPMIEISGGPSERGRQHGEAAREEIARSLAYYRDAFGASTGLSWSTVLEQAHKWRPVVERVAEDLLAEMAGIAEGAGVSEAEIMALNARGEIVRAVDSRFGRAGWDGEGCSSFAILPGGSGTGHVYSGQNWDWRSGTEDTTLLLRIVQPGKPTIIQQVEAGQIGRHGANSAGIALQANGMGMLPGTGLGGDFGGRIGLPQPVLRRLILDSAIMHDALLAPMSVRQQIACTLVITHRDGVNVTLEATPGAHRWRTTLRGRVVHTNHYEFGVPDQLSAEFRPASMSSLYRLPIIEAGLARLDEVTSPEKLPQVVRETMSDHFSYPCAVCEHDDERVAEVERYKTIMSTLADLTSGEYRVTSGNPCRSDYFLAPWNLYDGPGGQ